MSAFTELNPEEKIITTWCLQDTELVLAQQHLAHYARTGYSWLPKCCQQKTLLYNYPLKRIKTISYIPGTVNLTLEFVPPKSCDLGGTEITELRCKNAQQVEVIHDTILQHIRSIVVGNV